VPTIGDETIEEFAGRVTDEWKLGRKGVDDGVLFAIAMKERRMRIHTGRGVQGTLTDALSKRIISDIVSPRFRNGDFAGGIDAGVDAIMKAIEGEELPLPKEAPKPGKFLSPGDVRPAHVPAAPPPAAKADAPTKDAKGAKKGKAAAKPAASKPKSGGKK